MTREVREEARVHVEAVHVLGSQPWPIGRFGGCELMIGCFAKASSYEILVNAEEMEDVQWFERADLTAAVNLYEENPEVSLQGVGWGVRVLGTSCGGAGGRGGGGASPSSASPSLSPLFYPNAGLGLCGCTPVTLSLHLPADCRSITDL